MTTATKREKILYSIKKNIEIFKENLKEDCDIDDIVITNLECDVFDDKFYTEPGGSGIEITEIPTDISFSMSIETSEVTDDYQNPHNFRTLLLEYEDVDDNPDPKHIASYYA
tara:strand:- start:150 stop:485 length:336 start_codon:yes stop_codon:yes gene_type:complete